MLNLLKAEFYKLKTSKMFYFSILLSFLQVSLVYIFSERFKLMNGKDSVLYMFDIQSQLALDILIGIFASDFIVTEFTSGYIKNLIAYGHKRISIFISKSIAYYAGVIIISIIPLTVIICINTVMNGYGEAFTYSSVMFLIRIFLIMAIIYIAIGSISVLVAFVSRNVNITISIITALDFINRFFVATAMQKPLIKSIYDKYIFAQPAIILSDKCTPLEFLQAIIISLITILLTIAAGSYVFKKVDIN